LKPVLFDTPEAALKAARISVNLDARESARRDHGIS
jgi:hypothetical protein